MINRLAKALLNISNVMILLNVTEMTVLCMWLKPHYRAVVFFLPLRLHEFRKKGVGI